MTPNFGKLPRLTKTANNEMKFKLIRSTNHRWHVFIWIVLAFFSFLFVYIHFHFTQDDAYITYRYARNISTGIGFVYNRGEWVLGTTTPLYTLLLAFGNYYTGIPTEWLSIYICGFSLWLCAGSLYELKKHQNALVGLLIGLLFLTQPLLRYSMGMESYFFVMLLLISIWLYKIDKLILSAIFGGLACITRYEGVILIGLLCLIDYTTKRKPPVWLGIAIIPFAAWILYAYRVFGSTIPLSASAKFSSPHLSFLLGFFTYWYHFISENIFGFLILVFCIYGLLSVLIRRQLPKSYDLVVVYGIIYFIIAAIIAGTVPWYYVPFVPALAIFSWVGVENFSNIPPIPGFQDLSRVYKFSHGYLKYILCICLICVQLTYWIKDYIAYRDDIFDQRFQYYAQVSDWLIKNAPPDATLATYEIGYIGYKTNMKIIDLSGLVTPGLFQWLDDGPDETLLNGLKLFAPDYVLISSDREKQVRILNSDDRYHVAVSYAPNYLLYEKK